MGWLQAWEVLAGRTPEPLQTIKAKVVVEPNQEDIMRATMGLLALGAIFLAGGFFILEEGLIVAGLVTAGLSPLAYIASLKGWLSSPQKGSALEARLAQMETRLSLTEGELATANLELDRLRAEREFDRQLIGKAAETEQRLPSKR